jgi:hypothetical protein
MPDMVNRKQKICFGCLREMPSSSRARVSSAFCLSCRLATGDFQLAPSAPPTHPSDRSQPASTPPPSSQELITLALISALGFWKDA